MNRALFIIQPLHLRPVKDRNCLGHARRLREEFTGGFLRHYMEEYCAFARRVLTANAPGDIGDLGSDADKLSR